MMMIGEQLALTQFPKNPSLITIKNSNSNAQRFLSFHLSQNFLYLLLQLKAIINNLKIWI